MKPASDSLIQPKKREIGPQKYFKPQITGSSGIGANFNSIRIALCFSLVLKMQRCEVCFRALLCLWLWRNSKKLQEQPIGINLVS